VFSAAERVRNLVWERRLDVSTRGVVAVDHPDASLYAAMHYVSINRALAALELWPDDVFVDIGCGKGRVLCCAARSRVAKVVGVDLSEEFCEQARQNARRVRGLRAPIEVTTGLAEEFDYSECTAFFMFSPFGPDTMRKVLSKIHADRGQRPVRIAYAHPAYPAPFAEQAWLERYDFWDHAQRPDKHSVAFYRSVA
jgi:cyclopropane fatty-acyl-phospholipid synthase-like methyltransferase